MVFFNREKNMNNYKQIKDEELIFLYKTQNMSIQSIKKIYKRSHQYISKRLKNLGFDIKYGNTQYDIDELESYEWLYNQKVLQKKSTKQISEELGVNYHLVRRKLKKHGITTSDPRTMLDDRINDKGFLYDLHFNENLTCAEISNLLGCHHSTVGKKFSDLNIEVRNDIYRSEPEYWAESFLKSLDIKTKICDRSLIAPYELDIVIPEHKIAIELDGLFYHSELFKDKNYHKTKTDLCESKGYQLLHIFEDEWLYKRDIVERMIKAKLGLLDDRVYARKCSIGGISKLNKKNFLNTYHIQGNCNSSVEIGLYEQEELIASMAFKKLSNGAYELTRYATSKSVVGGFSKLLEHFKKNYEWNEIITFADRRYSNGGLYEKCGFDLIDRLYPDYYYVDNKQNRFHKFNFRHIFLKKKLKNYDPTLSEHQNCLNHGYYRIYDCGKLKYRLKN